MAFPLGLAAWSTLGALAAYRALVRPVRALVARGAVTCCPGAPSCGPGLTVESAQGVAEVYSVVPGPVVRSQPGHLEIASALEPVIAVYHGPFAPTVRVGQVVATGEAVARAGSVTLSIAQFERLADGALRTFWVEPASWLAARGLRPATQLTGGAGWCMGGRRLIVPQDVSRGGLRLPDPAAFALLPVNVRVA